MGLIEDLRADVGDDDDVIPASGVIVDSEAYNLIVDIRVDNGDDTEISLS